MPQSQSVRAVRAKKVLFYLSLEPSLVSASSLSWTSKLYMLHWPLEKKYGVIEHSLNFVRRLIIITVKLMTGLAGLDSAALGH